MTQFVVRRLKTGQKIVALEDESMMDTSAWFEPSEHAQGHIDFKVNGIATLTTGIDVEPELDEFASKWMNAFGRDGDVDLDGQRSHMVRGPHASRKRLNFTLSACPQGQRPRVS